MDARITKQRLANMLSYDWLKILGAIALAAVFFCMFFVMIATRATDGQTFYVYAYDGLDAGRDFNLLENSLLDKKVFGYDILNTGSEAFKSGGMYGNSVFTARRSAGEGRVMFVSDVRTTDENGKENSTLLGFMDYAGEERESFGLFLDPEKFLADCKTYLSGFFGEDLSAEEPDAGKVRETFMARNAKDKRFRSAAKKEEGVAEERKRVKKLKEDYLTVAQAVGDTLSYVSYTTEIKTHVIGFSMNALNLTPLVYYTVEDEEEGVTVQSNKDVALCIFDNGTREGDLKYETVNFLAYLLKTYGTAQ